MIIMCCGNRRAALRLDLARPASPPVPRPADPAPASPALDLRGSELRLRYAGVSPLNVEGPVTGRAYAFSAASPDLPVDIRDAALLVRNGLFQAM
jgi:hypothetical protein